MAEICSQKAPGQDLAQNGRFPMVPKGNCNCWPRGRQMAESCSQNVPGQDLANNGRFPMVPEGNFNCRPRGGQMAESCSQKGSRPGFGPKRPFPNGPRKEFQLPAEGPPNGRKLLPKRLPARIWPKTAVSQWSQKGISIAS